MVLSGWLSSVRRFGGVAFARLRDASGELQLVADARGTSGGGEGALAALAGAPEESAVRVRGAVRLRPPAESRPEEGPAGELELAVHDVEVLNAAVTPLPIPVGASSPAASAGGEAALRWRHLELRGSAALRRNLRTRAAASAAARAYLAELGFLEVETPTLFRPTPEGAREFLVPARGGPPGAAYALPQSPQQYKQLLMAAGVERYFQVARCYRDELGRADRQPEFTQVDLEASFVGADDVMRVLEGLARAMWASAGQAGSIRCAEGGAFRRMAYEEALLAHGTDKPDLRLEAWRSLDVTDVFAPAGESTNDGEVLGAGAAALGSREASELPSALAGAAASGGAVWAFAARGAAAALSKSALARATDGMEVATLAVGADGDGADAGGMGGGGEVERAAAARWSGPLARRVGPAARRALSRAAALCRGDALVLAAAPDAREAAARLARAREALQGALRSAGHTLVPPERAGYEFVFVTDFPLFERAGDERGGEGGPEGGAGVSPAHHPFTAPAPGHEGALLAALRDADAEALLRVPSQAYDLVCNGVELGGGSVRIHDAGMQRAVLRGALGLDAAAQEASFGHLLAALSHGCPPHAGAALGLDRAVALLAGGPRGASAPIRDAIAFPKSAAGNEPLTGAPAIASAEALAEYGVRTLGGGGADDAPGG